jgi:threonine/homoserine/homoserine lactone efflux protein
LLASAAPAGMQVRDLQASSPLRQIAGGFLCNAFNPKAPIYFPAQFTMALSPGLPLPTLLNGSRWSRCCWLTTRVATERSTPPRWRLVCACWQLRAIESD